MIENQDNSDYKFEPIRTGDNFMEYTSYRKEIVTGGTQLNNVQQAQGPPTYDYFATFNLVMAGLDANFIKTFSGNPYHFPVVKITTTDKQKNQKSILSFEYFDGVYDPSLSFVKFNKVKQILPNNNGYIVSYYYNDLSVSDGSQFPDLTTPINNIPNAGYLLDGLMYKSETYGSDGQRVQYVDNDWKLWDKGNGAYYVYLEGATKHTLEQISLKNTFTYNTSNGQKQEEIQYNPNSSQIHLRTEYTYITDTSVVSKHILTWPDETTLYNKNGLMLKKNKNTYDYDRKILLYKSKWVDSNKDGTYASYEMVHNTVIDNINSKGAVTQSHSTETGVYTTISYDKYNGLPVAVTKNAREDQVFYDGFEDEGRWSGAFGNVSITTSPVLAGEHAVRLYQTGGGPDTPIYFYKVLNGSYLSGETYKISAWIKGAGAYFKVLDNTGAIVFSSFGNRTSGANWQLYEGEFTLNSNATELDIYCNAQTDTPGGDLTVYFDELRFHPKEALMTSTTYDPVKLTTLTKENNLHNLTYIRYDAAGRTVQVADAHHNVLSENLYHLSNKGKAPFDKNDPNYKRSVNYTSKIISGKYANMAPNFGFELDNPGTSKRPAFWKGDIFNADDSTYSIENVGVNNSLAVKLLNSSAGNITDLMLWGSQTKEFTIDSPQNVDWSTIAFVNQQGVAFKIWQPGPNGQQTVYVQATETSNGTKFLESGVYKVTTSSYTEDSHVKYVQGTFNASIATDYIPIDEGIAYTLSGFLKSQGASTAWLGLRWYNADKNLLREDFPAQNAGSNDWAEYTATYTAPSGAVYTKLIAENKSGNTPVWFDNIQFVRNNQKIEIKTNMATAYLDGYGRNFQNQIKKYQPDSSAYNLVVTGTEFDSLGRAYRQYLPIELDLTEINNYHDFVPDYISRCIAAHNPDANNRPFSEIKYLKDPTSRVSISNLQGKNGSVSTPDYNTAYNYELNQAGDVSGYGANTLFKTKLTDYTQGNSPVSSSSYTDPFGNTLKTVKDEGGLNKVTDYTYDDLGQLLQTTNPVIRDYDSLQPLKTATDQKSLMYNGVGTTLNVSNMESNGLYKKAVVSYAFYTSGNLSDSRTHNDIPANATVVRVTITYMDPPPPHQYGPIYQYDFKLKMEWKIDLPDENGNLITKYKYNNTGQITEQTLPDKGTTEYIYNKYGRLRFKRDAADKAIGKMVYFKYDYMGRILETGKYTDAGFNRYNAEDANYPSSGAEKTVINHYDNAGYNGAHNLQGRLAYKAYKNNSASFNDYKTWYSYNDKGQVEWIVQKVKAIEKKIEYIYTLNGNLAKMIYDSSGADQLFYWYTYDNSGVFVAQYTNTADNFATAKREIKLGGTTALGLQKQIVFGNDKTLINYTYDPLYGWMDEINATKNGTSLTMDMKLYHNETPYGGVSYYNGTVNAYEIEYPALSGVAQNHHRYTFGYDNLMQIKSADYRYKTTSWSGATNKYKLVHLNYDENGNILTLKRYNNNGAVMHDYYYVYNTGTNQLAKRTYEAATQ